MGLHAQGLKFHQLPQLRGERAVESIVRQAPALATPPPPYSVPQVYTHSAHTRQPPST